jgi:hypothetical protein
VVAALLSSHTVRDAKPQKPHLADQNANHAMILQLCKVLVERGLLDAAAREIHNAGPDAPLRALAQNVSGRVAGVLH